MLDGNTAALNIKEREDHRLDIEFNRQTKWAEQRVYFLLARVDTDVLRDAFKTINSDDWRHLVEDLGDGTMRDYAHAGLIMRDVLERYLFAEAMKEIRE